MTDHAIIKEQNVSQSTTLKKKVNKKKTRKKSASTSVSKSAYRKLNNELSSVKEENSRLKQEIDELKKMRINDC